MQRPVRSIPFLLIVCSLVTLLISACSQPAAPEAAPDTQPAAAESQPAAAAPAEAAAQGNEAPMLAELVASGDLPPLEERLPAEPLVLDPVEGIGVYGGTMRFGVVETNLWNFTCLRTSGLFRYNQENSQVVADMAQSFEFSDDLTTLRINLRDGHKWSDGTPFTVDDIMFRWEDVANNPDLSPAGPGGFWTPGGEPAVFTKISDTELEITFAVPYPVVVDLMGRSWFSSDPQFMLPKHYLEKWHLKYNPDAEALAKEEQFETWMDAFRAHAYPSNNFEVGRPVLNAWMPEQITSDRAVAVRNPYFYQVDTAGNQLPYIDRIDVAITGNKEVQILKASSGELDLEAWYLSLAEMPVLQQNKEQGNYDVRMAQSLRTSEFALMLNRTVQDDVLRDLFNNKDFRVALSLGIDREAINDAVFFGLAKPFPAIPLPANSYFQPEWAEQYIQHDPDQANQLLDELGLTERDGDGFRLRSDGGGRLNVLVEIGSQEGPKMAICELVKAHWEQIGIEATCKETEGSLYTQRNLGNELQVATWHLDRAGLFGRADPLWFGFTSPSQQRWAVQWATWFTTNGAEGEEPPAEIQELKALFEEFQRTLPGTPEFNELGAQYYAYFANELPMIGTVGLGPVPMLVSNRLHNVPAENIWWGSDTNFYAPYLPAQWYIQE